MDNVKTKFNLEDITSNVFKRIFHRDICLPSDYIQEFNKEIDSKEIDLDKEISKKILEDYEKSKHLIQEAEKTLSQTTEIIEHSIEALSEKNYKEVEKLKDDMDMLFKHIRSLTYELHTDELTKAYNRKWFFNDFLIQENYMPETGTMIFIDIDNFKNINDRYGHHVGDKVLKFFVNFMNKEFNERNYSDNDFKIVRFAGDEFIIIVKDNKENIDNTIRKINEKIKKVKIIPHRGEEIFHVEFSYGVKDYNRGDDIHEIMKNADGAMYHMKNLRKSERS